MVKLGPVPLDVRVSKIGFQRDRSTYGPVTKAEPDLNHLLHKS
jgi:hypothetical protein